MKEIKLNAEAIRRIEALVNKGKDALIYRRKDGIVVASETRKIEYRTAPRGE